jgi:benzoate/toluate 1,2-dioxygenase reductase component
MKIKNPNNYRVKMTSRRWLTEAVFEVVFSRPEGFVFLPGQKVQLKLLDMGREYTLINQPEDQELKLCVRHVVNGRFTPLLAQAKIGDIFFMSPATGFFTYQKTTKPVVFMATGTGIAPFVAYVRAGVRGFFLFHGGRTEEELYYQEEVAKAARHYIPCLSGPGDEGQSKFLSGHITKFLQQYLKEAVYDFYLCGNRDMVRDTIRIIDRRFPGSRVFMEPFF